MEIKEPKFKVGDRVTTPQKGREVFGTIARIKFYDFPKGTYIYTVKFEIDGFTEELYLDELVLDSYTYKPKTVWDLKEREECYPLTICGNVHHGFWDGSFSSIAIRDTGGMYRIVSCDGWCEKFERKTKEENNKNYVYNYTCPNCHTILSEVENCNYCPECGTKLDWSKKE